MPIGFVDSNYFDLRKKEKSSNYRDELVKHISGHLHLYFSFCFKWKRKAKTVFFDSFILSNKCIIGFCLHLILSRRWRMHYFLDDNLD